MGGLPEFCILMSLPSDLYLTFKATILKVETFLSLDY